MISKSDNTKKVAIYGSTGSIGKQALHIMEELGNAKVSTLVCNSNIELLARQIEKYQPKIAGIANPKKIEENKKRELTELLRTSSKAGTRLVFGRDESMQACCSDETDIVLSRWGCRPYSNNPVHTSQKAHSTSKQGIASCWRQHSNQIDG
jgi:1-deoxy-D-xylulose 5-phosphate reductoisomerase